ncbi:peroxisomal membrane protein 11C isoform X2 [Fukomys damarensis]|uniref:peroxisomal membrane protein 11C isoform X2 n=1 Tax=Fukomys damarensis TaxID=885580 RepID=UPI0008FF2644|nr:peroxisomal membrane protein 11C isoform X2 [Fukomys damarensis]
MKIRTLGYCCQLVGGVLLQQGPAGSEVGTRLLAVSAQLSHCRTVLRLFDDLAMFLYTKHYGLGTEEEDALVRCVSVLGNMADQLYYPCEHVAWAADAKVLHVDSARWWTLSTALWALSLLLGVARSLWMVLTLRRRLQGPTAAFTRIRSEVLGVPEITRGEEMSSLERELPGAKSRVTADDGDTYRPHRRRARPPILQMKPGSPGVAWAPAAPQRQPPPRGAELRLGAP